MNVITYKLAPLKVARGHHTSMDLSVPTIMKPHVQYPNITSLLVEKMKVWRINNTIYTLVNLIDSIFVNELWKFKRNFRKSKNTGRQMGLCTVFWLWKYSAFVINSFYTSKVSNDIDTSMLYCKGTAWHLLTKPERLGCWAGCWTIEPRKLWMYLLWFLIDDIFWIKQRLIVIANVWIRLLCQTTKCGYTNTLLFGKALIKMFLIQFMLKNWLSLNKSKLIASS